MTMNNNAKFEGKLTFHCKTDMRNLTNLTRAIENLKNCSLICCLIIQESCQVRQFYSMFSTSRARWLL